jgi:aminoglycoside/choline kinase family phosphotransferase
MPEAHSHPPELTAWLAASGFPAREIAALPGDVSPRRYFRIALAAGGTAVLAVYPDAADPSACRRFARTTALLSAAGVRVPAVLAEACARGWTLVEDLGRETLYDHGRRPWPELLPFYASAGAAAARIAGLPRAAVAGLSPPLDEALLRRELDQTWSVLLEPRGLLGDAATARVLAEALARLCANLAAAEPVPCHRDLMPRNLVPLEGGTVAVLDHQDLRLGPPAYDLASLLNDSLFPPAWMEEELLAGAPGRGLDRLDYHRAAAQRALKAAGTFAAFARRGVDRHLPLIGPTLGRGLDHLAAVPEGVEAARRLAGRWRARGVC